MTLPVYPTLPGLTFTVLKTPEFSNLVMSAPNAYDVRISQSVNPVWNYTLIYDFLHDFQWGGFSITELRTLMGFFLQMQGKNGAFLFVDPDDSYVGPALTTQGWTASTYVTVGYSILDSANHWQLVTAVSPSSGVGLTGSTVPSFNHSGGSTSDNQVTWTDQGTYSGGAPNYQNARLQLVSDGAGNYYSPIQRSMNGVQFEDITDLNGSISVYVNGTLATAGTSAGSYQLLGPGLAINGYSYMGMYLKWGAIAAAWQASHYYALNATILDPSGHVQMATVAGTSGSSIPIFNDSGGTTEDSATTSITIASIQVTHVTTPIAMYVLTVTFTTAPPSFFTGQQYTFSGLTTYTALNGQTIVCSGVSGDTATFNSYAASSTYGPASDTGTATVQISSLLWQDEGAYTGPGTPITAQFNYYFRVRFATDSVDFEKFLGVGSSVVTAGQGGGYWTIGGSESQNGTGTLKLTSARPVPL